MGSFEELELNLRVGFTFSTQRQLETCSTAKQTRRSPGFTFFCETEKNYVTEVRIWVPAHGCRS